MQLDNQRDERPAEIERVYDKITEAYCYPQTIYRFGVNRHLNDDENDGRPLISRFM